MGPCDVEKHGADGECASACRAAPDDAGEDEQRRGRTCEAGKNGDREEEADGVLAAPVEEEGHGEVKAEKLKGRGRAEALNLKHEIRNGRSQRSMVRGHWGRGEEHRTLNIQH